MAGRPSEYKEEYIAKVDEYLAICQDEYRQVVKYSSEKSEGYEEKLKVKLPTMGGFSLFIGVPERTIYDWKKEGDTFDPLREDLEEHKYKMLESKVIFSQSLEKILKEQQQRLIDMGLSGEYNSTIAKLILSSNHGMKERTDQTSDDKPIQNTITFVPFNADSKPEIQ